MADGDNVKYCIQCGALLSRKVLFGQTRPYCQTCGWIYFADPKVAAGVVVRKEDQVLLIRRINEPGRGFWSFPAGFVDAHEDPARAAERECLEETGLVVKVTGILDLVSGREHERGADIIIVYNAEVVGGSLLAGDDADLAQFFEMSSLPPLAFNATRIALALLKENQG